MSTQNDKCNQNYFDGMKIGKKQRHFLIFLIAGTFLEQIDLYKFSLIAPALRELWGVSVAQITAINAAFAAGAVLGGFFSAWFSDIKGRHLAMTLALFLAGGGALTTSMAPNYEVLLICRTICGFGISAAMVLEAPYLTEMVPAETRSRWQGIIGVLALTGIPISTAVSKMILSTGIENWRIIAAIPGLAIVIGILFWKMVPESPRWLVSHNRVDEAKKVFKDITGQELHIDVTECTETKKVSYIETIKFMLRKDYLKRSVFILTINIVFANAGYMITQMLPTLLTSEGVATSTAMTVQQILSLTMMIGPLYVILFGDKGGRKIPYAVAMIIAGISILGIAIAGTDNLPLLFLATAMAGWSMITHQSFGAVYTPELYPTSIRGMVVGVSTVCTRGSTVFLQAAFVPFLYNTYGYTKYMFVVSGIYLVMSMFILAVAPRTAGKSLEELNRQA